METLGLILGYLIALIIFIVKRSIHFIFKLFGQEIFKNEKKIPVLTTSKIKRKGNVNKEASFRKGEEFENYVRNNLFTKDKYGLIERTHSYESNKNDFIESTLKADFKFRHNLTGKEFYVEAKWRQNLYYEHLEFSYPDQLKRYKTYSKQVPFYVVIGLGGTANNPDKIFMENIDQLYSHKIHINDLSHIDFQSQRKKYRLN